MTFAQLDRYLLSKPGSSYDYPFDEVVRVYRVV
jgi:predicted DNA-binding protein (MmcQ/YjbR family)